MTRSAHNRSLGTWAQLNDPAPLDLGIRTGRSSSTHPNQTNISSGAPAPEHWLDGIMTDNPGPYAANRSPDFEDYLERLEGRRGSWPVVRQQAMEMLQPVFDRTRELMLIRLASGEELYTPEVFYECNARLRAATSKLTTEPWQVPVNAVDSCYANATWMLMREALRFYHGVANRGEAVLDRVLGQLIPGLAATEPMSGMDKYSYSGFSALFRPRLTEFVLQYQSIFHDTVSGPSLDAEAQVVHIGTALLHVLYDTLADLQRRIPELPDSSSFDLCARAAAGALALIELEPSANMFREEGARTILAHLPRVEQAMLAGFSTRFNNDPMEAIPCLAAKIDFVQRCFVRTNQRREEASSSFGETIERMTLMMAVADVDPQWAAVEGHIGFRGIYLNEVNMDTQSTMPEPLIQEIGDDMPSGLFDSLRDHHEVSLRICCALVAVASWEQVTVELSDAGSPPVPQPLDPNGPQVGEVWGDPADPETWTFLESYMYEDEYSATRFVGQLFNTPPSRWHELGYVRIFPPAEIKRASLPISAGRRSLRLRNSLQALPLDE